MKYLRLFFLFFLCSFSAKDNSIPVIAISHGMYEHGERAISLSPEGLILRSTCIRCDGYNESVKFFRINEIDNLKIISLNEFLIRNKYFEDFKHRYLMEGNGLVTPRQYLIKNPTTNCNFLILDYDFFNHSINESSEREKLDSLVILINALIPSKYSKEYQIK